MGSSSTVKAATVYDHMQGVVVTQLTPYFSIENIEFTDVQAESTIVERDYALVKQFNVALVPHTVSGTSRKQIASIIVELNYGKGKAETARNVANSISHYFSGTSFEHDIIIDSVTSNTYDNASGSKSVVVIDFNYLVRV